MGMYLATCSVQSSHTPAVHDRQPAATPLHSARDGPRVGQLPLPLRPVPPRPVRRGGERQANRHTVSHHDPCRPLHYSCHPRAGKPLSMAGNTLRCQSPCITPDLSLRSSESSLLPAHMISTSTPAALSTPHLTSAGAEEGRLHIQSLLSLVHLPTTLTWDCHRRVSVTQYMHSGAARMGPCSAGEHKGLRVPGHGPPLTATPQLRPERPGQRRPAGPLD